MIYTLYYKWDSIVFIFQLYVLVIKNSRELSYEYEKLVMDTKNSKIL